VRKSAWHCAKSRYWVDPSLCDLLDRLSNGLDAHRETAGEQPLPEETAWLLPSGNKTLMLSISCCHQSRQIGINCTLLRAHINFFVVAIRANAAETPLQPIRPLRDAIRGAKSIQLTSAITGEQKTIPKPWPF
jgi:hypothetical protein